MSRAGSAAVYALSGTFDTENKDGTINFGTWRGGCTALEPLSATMSRNATTLAKHVENRLRAQGMTVESRDLIYKDLMNSIKALFLLPYCIVQSVIAGQAKTIKAYLRTTRKATYNR
ncbi:hypothetical protein FQA39_LY09145 [Lamprigera yunnana]|nr:hypothetical protein FQA39_LY09145 [Lamprigera yunnana]